MIKKIRQAIKTFFLTLINLVSIEAKDIVIENYSGGLLGIGEKDTDFLLGGNVLEMKKKLSKKMDLKRELIYEYNQGALTETSMWCTIFSAVTELSFLFNRKFTICEIREIGNAMIADKLLSKDGAYLSDAVDYTRRWWNEKFPDQLVESYQIDYTDAGLIKVLEELIPRPTQLGYMTSSELYRDTFDGIADKESYPIGTGGHAVTKWKKEIVNNYKKDSGINRFKFTKLQKLIENGVVFQKGYLFLKK